MAEMGEGEGLPGAAESSKKMEEIGRKEGLPGAARKWQKLGVGRGCHELPVTGKNQGRGGAAVSCQRMAKMRGGKWLS